VAEARSGAGIREYSEAVEGIIPISGEIVGEKGKRGRKRGRSEHIFSIF